jgi:hypothetical protein
MEIETEDKTSGFKQKLGQWGRSLKRIDVRQTIVDNPFAAVGIAAALGAIAGVARPMPERGRLSGAIISTLGLIAFKLVRDTAIRELGTAAKKFVFERREQEGSSFGEQSQSSGGVRYTPAL